MSVLSIDFETRSTVDLKKCGVYVYAEDPSTEILCMAYSFDGEEPGLLTDLDLDSPADDEAKRRIYQHISAGGEIRAWNAMFERVIWGEIMSHLSWPEPNLEQWHDTAAEAAAMALPRALDQCARVLGLKVRKDDEGYKLMLKMCKPRKPTKEEKKQYAGMDMPVLWHDSPADRERLGLYCCQDVRTEQAVAPRVRRLSTREREVYLLDQHINDRGVSLDVALVHAAQAIVEEGTRRANDELDELTAGAATVTTPEAIRKWMAAAGVETENLQKATVRDLLAGEGGELPESVRRVLELRSVTAKTSNAKLAAMLNTVCRDGKVRGMLLYHGASTGRWSGKLLQPQNFPRPAVEKVERFIQLVMENQFDLIESQEPALVVISSMLRSMLIASEGRRFLSGDFAQIEARIVAWLAKQQDLLDLFARGGKVYETMAAYIYKCAVEEIKNPSERRTVGKESILGSGFGMGWEAFQKNVKLKTGIDLTDEEAQSAITGYRELYPLVVELWKDFQNAAMRAVENPGTIERAGRNGCIKFVVRGPWLWVVLPTGRVLAYAMPKIQEKEPPWSIKARAKAREAGEPEPVRQMKKTVTCMGVNGVTRQWERFHTYGGFWCENITQAIARDLMADAMLRAEDAGYECAMTVHDEIVADTDSGSLQEFLKIMRVVPEWASGLPVAVDGRENVRYGK